MIPIFHLSSQQLQVFKKSHLNLQNLGRQMPVKMSSQKDQHEYAPLWYVTTCSFGSITK